MKQILCIAWVFIALGNGYLHAQDCECDKNYEKIFVDKKDKWMHGMYHDDKQLGGHPYSTFSKTHPGSYIEGVKTCQDSIKLKAPIIINSSALSRFQS